MNGSRAASIRARGPCPILIMVAFAAGCTPELISGNYGCNPDQTANCPAGWLCKKVGEACEYRCVNAAPGTCGDGVLDPGEALSAQQLADALAAGNNMLDNWSSDEGMILASVDLSFNTVAATAAYTIGPAMDIAIATAPRAVKSAHGVLTSGPRFWAGDQRSQESSSLLLK